MLNTFTPSICMSSSCCWLVGRRAGGRICWCSWANSTAASSDCDCAPLHSLAVCSGSHGAASLGFLSEVWVLFLGPGPGSVAVCFLAALYWTALHCTAGL